jgi:Cu(I)/Ag(I) efflux system membrane fusion protein
MSKSLIAIILVAIISFVAGVIVDENTLSLGVFSDEESAHETAMEHAKKHLDQNYVCPMHSEILSAEPGSCPICGMDLVEIRRDETVNDNSEYPEVRISSIMINNMGVRVAEVERKTLVRTIETPGFIQQMTKASYSSYNAPASGKVVKFYFEIGQWHEQGEPLLDIELDDLVEVQQKHLELLAAANNPDGDNSPGDVSTGESTAMAATEAPAQDSPESQNQTAAAAVTLDRTRTLMKLAGMTDEQIEKLEQTGETSPVITLYASHAGEVKELRVAVGDEVRSRQLLFMLGGLMRVSVLANAFQRDASWVKAGQDVDIILPHDSQKPWKGKVSSGAVSINTNSQNIGVRLTFDAPDSVVKSGMYVVGNIYGQVREDTLTVPRDAVIYSRDEKRVVLVLGRGRFKPVRVETGISNDREVEILSGLEEGDTIVVSAQFLIDSESSLQASYRRMKAVE